MATIGLLFQALLAAGAGLIAACALALLHKIITNRWSLARFKKLSRNMPMFADARLLSNHTSSMVMGSENCKRVHETHAKLGPYVGALMGDVFIVSTTDLDLIKRVVLDEGHLDRPVMKLPMSEFEQSIMAVPEEEWRPLRRVFGGALRNSKFKAPNVRAEIEQSIGKLIGHIERRLAGTSAAVEFELDDIAHKYTLNLVFSCFYKQYNLIDFDDPQDHWTRLLDSMFEGCQRSRIFRLGVIFPPLRHLIDWLVWNFHAIGRGRARILGFVKLQARLGLEARQQLAAAVAAAATTTEKEAISNINNNNNINNNSCHLSLDSFKMADGSLYRRNMVDDIIDGLLEGKITRQQYLDSTCFLLMAADKTVVDALTSTLHLLSVNPRVQDKLRESLEREGADSEYLGWVLNESMRLAPPASIGSSRTVKHDIELASGHLIPRGTLLITTSYAIHRLKEYWGEDAEEFRPERWADTSNHHPCQFLAFGVGQRACLGRDFALFHMRALLSALLTRYKFHGELPSRPPAFDSPGLLITVFHSVSRATIARLQSVR